MRAEWRWIAVTAAVGALSVGCGDDESNEVELLSIPEYRAALVGLDYGQADRLYYDMVVEPLPQDRCALLIRSFADEVGGLVETVASLEPPTEVAAIHDRMVTAAEESAMEVEETAEQVEGGDLRCGNEINERLYGMPSTERALSALDELRKPVGLPSGE